MLRLYYTCLWKSSQKNSSNVGPDAALECALDGGLNVELEWTPPWSSL